MNYCWYIHFKVVHLRAETQSSKQLLELPFCRHRYTATPAPRATGDPENNPLGQPEGPKATGHSPQSLPLGPGDASGNVPGTEYEPAEDQTGSAVPSDPVGATP